MFAYTAILVFLLSTFFFFFKKEGFIGELIEMLINGPSAVIYCDSGCLEVLWWC